MTDLKQKFSMGQEFGQDRLGNSAPGGAGRDHARLRATDAQLWAGLGGGRGSAVGGARLRLGQPGGSVHVSGSSAWTADPAWGWLAICPGSLSDGVLRPLHQWPRAPKGSAPRGRHTARVHPAPSRIRLAKVSLANASHCGPAQSPRERGQHWA